MSVKIMGLVWDLDNQEIDREEKYILLAYADHADHKGFNIYPAVSTIAEKTGYKERAVQMITRSLKGKGYLVADGKGVHGTNKWCVPLEDGGARIAPAKNAGVQNTASRGAKRKVQGVHPNAPKPSEPSSQPSVKEGASATPPKPPTPEEVKLFREVKGRYPNKATYELVTEKIQKMSARLLRPVTKEDLRPFYVSWTSKGYNPENLAWLDWAVSGVVPANAKIANIQEPKSFQGIRDYIKSMIPEEVVNGFTK